MVDEKTLRAESFTQTPPKIIENGTQGEQNGCQMVEKGSQRGTLGPRGRQDGPIGAQTPKKREKTRPTGSLMGVTFGAFLRF